MEIPLLHAFLEGTLGSPFPILDFPQRTSIPSIYAITGRWWRGSSAESTPSIQWQPTRPTPSSLPPSPAPFCPCSAEPVPSRGSDSLLSSAMGFRGSGNSRLVSRMLWAFPGREGLDFYPVIRDLLCKEVRNTALEGSVAVLCPPSQQPPSLGPDCWPGTQLVLVMW